MAGFARMLTSIVLVTTCLWLESSQAEEEWLAASWPAIFGRGGPGEQLVVREIDVSLSKVVTRSAGGSRRSYDGFMTGPHSGLADLPHAQLFPLNDSIFDPEGTTSKGLLAHLRRSGSNVVRIYSAYWWDPLGAAESIRVLAHFGHVPSGSLSEMIGNWSYPDARAVFDYLSGNDFDVAMVITTIYCDPETKKVYPTCDVADDVDGVLAKAAERNAGTLARWWASHGHGRRLVLEIGNEGIGYGKDEAPTEEQYARIVKAFTKAIKAVNPAVEVAMVTEPRFVKNDNPGYEYDYRVRKMLGLCKEVAADIDHVIVHLYDRHSRDWSLTYPSDARRHLDLVSADLDANGYTKTRILITEYNFDLWSGHRDTVGHAVANGSRQIVIAGHPRVSGLCIHFAPGPALFDYSDGRQWMMSPPGAIVHQGGENRHIPDSRGNDLGSRFRMLPTGYVQALLARACRGKLIDAYAMNDFGQIAYLLTTERTTVRVLVANLQPATLRINVPELTEASVSVFSAHCWDVAATDDLQQPYGITDSKKETLTHVDAPAFSVTLVEGQPSTPRKDASD